MRHAAYAAGWKKFEPVWDLLIGLKRAGQALPLLEGVLDAGVRHRSQPSGKAPQVSVQSTVSGDAA